MDFRVMAPGEAGKAGCDPARWAVMQRRYQEALRLSQWFERWGGRVRLAAAPVSSVITVISFLFATACREIAQQVGLEFHGGLFKSVLVLGLVAAVAAAIVFNLLGTLLAGRGQFLRTSLEIAINTSSLFNDDQRWELLEALSVPPGHDRPWMASASGGVA
jgi:hypothetical protein